MARDKASLDIFWLRDESLEDTENLPPPDVIAAEIVEDLEAALAQFAEIAVSLQTSTSVGRYLSGRRYSRAPGQPRPTALLVLARVFRIAAR
jgi:hypothetical protein